MPNQYSGLTKTNIERKINRKRNPVRNVVELAEEFGYITNYDRHTPETLWGRHGRRAPSSFVKEVKTLIGTRAYNTLRDSKRVNVAYR